MLEAPESFRQSRPRAGFFMGYRQCRRPHGKENRSGDRRWLVLALAALFIATAAPLSRLASEIRAPCYGGARGPNFELGRV